MKDPDYDGGRDEKPGRNGRQSYGYTGYPQIHETEDGPLNNRTLQDYLRVVKERSWWLILAFSAVFIATLFYTYSKEPLFTSPASVEVLRDTPDAIGLQGLQDNTVHNLVDINTQIESFKSATIIERVQKRIQANPEFFNQFMRPYEGQSSGFLRGPLIPAEILSRNRSIMPRRQSRIIDIHYTHPSPEIAAKTANLFAEEFVNYNLKLSIKNLMKAVDDLKERADQQRKKVEESEMQLANYRESHNQVTIDPKDDIDREELTALRIIVTNDKKSLDEAEAQWEIVQQYKQENRNLWDISSIAAIPQVQTLLNDRSTNKIQVATLAERYRDKHPRMILAREALKQTETELAAALESAVQKMHSAYLQAEDNYARSNKKLIQKQKDIINLSKVRVHYNSMLRELEVNQTLYQYLVQRMQQHTTQVNIANSNVRVVDSATAALYPSSPRLAFNLLAGAFAGLILGFGLVFLLDFLDDRIKTAIDIEGFLGISLIGLIPKISKKDLRKNACAVDPNVDPRVTEAFRSTYSSLKLSNNAYNAKVILVTSTIPNEGKSLIISNLTATYAEHCERVLLIDCDLRASHLTQSLKLPNQKGLIQYCQTESRKVFANFVQKDVFPGVDLMGSGGVSKNASAILGSKSFQRLLSTAKRNYDVIFIDTPPTSVVSDASSLLRLVDGIIYVIKFNAVKRKMAKLNISRIQEARVPIFGAILNNIAASDSTNYYDAYGGRDSYPQYYACKETSEAVVAPPKRTVKKTKRVMKT